MAEEAISQHKKLAMGQIKTTSKFKKGGLVQNAKDSSKSKDATSKDAASRRGK